MSTIMEREDRQFEMVLDSLIQRSQDLMKALSTFLLRIETEQLEYNHYADAFASFQGHLQNIIKVVRAHSQSLAMRTVFPLKLAPMEDEMLINATEGRLRSLNHDTVPIYLRTKLEPEIEERLNAIAAKANTINNDQAQKQIQTANKISQNMVEMIRSHREEWDSNSRNPIPQTHSPTDTYILAGAFFNGKGLRPGSELIGGPSTTGRGPPGMGMAAAAAAAAASQQRPAMGKAQPSIKTNIKPATSIHQYRHA